MRLMAVIAASLVVSFGSLASAASCRDGKGKFITCPPVAAKKCRDAKGKFIKCDAATAATSAAH